MTSELQLGARIVPVLSACGFPFGGLIISLRMTSLRGFVACSVRIVIHAGLVLLSLVSLSTYSKLQACKVGTCRLCISYGSLCEYRQATGCARVYVVASPFRLASWQAGRRPRRKSRRHHRLALFPKQGMWACPHALLAADGLVGVHMPCLLLTGSYSPDNIFTVVSCAPRAPRNSPRRMGPNILFAERASIQFLGTWRYCGMSALNSSCSRLGRLLMLDPSPLTRTGSLKAPCTESLIVPVLSPRLTRAEKTMCELHFTIVRVSFDMRAKMGSSCAGSGGNFLTPRCGTPSTM